MSGRRRGEPWAAAMWLGVGAGLLSVGLVAALGWVVVSHRPQSQPVAAVCPDVVAGVQSGWSLSVIEDRTISDARQSVSTCVLQDERGVTTLTVVVRRLPATYRSAHAEAAAEVAFQCLAAERRNARECIDDLGPPTQRYGQTRIALIDDGETVLSVTMTGPSDRLGAISAQVAATFGVFQTDLA